MADYKLYCLNHRNRIVSARWVHATSDGAALAEAATIARELDCELWLGTRKVARLFHGRIAPVSALDLNSAAAESLQDSLQSGIPVG